MNTRWTVVAACVLTIRAAPGVPHQPPAGPPAELQNAGFEQGDAGTPPPGWILSPANARAQISAADPIEGKACAILSRADENDGSFANLLQSIDATALRAKRIELSASVRFVGAGQAQLWMRADRAGGAMGFFDNMADRPIRAEAWAGYSIRGDIDDDARTLTVGLFVINGPGRAWIDAVSIRVLGPAGAGSIAPAPLSDRGADNLAALARLVGVVRYFHPSTESSTLDWDAFTIRATIGVESASTPSELADRLGAWMAPVAPTVRVWVGPPDLAPVPTPRPDNATHSVGMKYRGYALPKESPAPSTDSVYSARRVREPLTKDQAQREIPPPGTAVKFDLGGGVSAMVPVILYADGTRTLPAATSNEPQTPPRPEGWSPSARDRATRLAAVALGWATLKHFYPYFDVTPDDWDAALRPALARAAQDPGPESFYRTLALMLAHLHDGHGYVRGPGQPVPAPRDFAWQWVGDQLVVSGVAPTQAQLKPGDVVLEIDGRRVTDLYAEIAPTICAATEGWRRARATSELGWAPGTGTVALLVRRAGNEVGVVLPRSGPAQYFRPSHPPDGSEVAPGIAYFNLDGAETAALTAAWPALLAARGVIFDLRGYPGSAGAALLPYLSDRPLESARWNIPVLTLPAFEAVRYDRSNWNLPPRQPRLTAPVAFLTGGGAISYAESCMGIVEAYGLGEIVGAPTAGSNGNVTVVNLPGGYGLSFTGMQVLKHDGSRHHGVGIRPTVPVEPTVEGLRAGRDEVLDKAIDVLNAKAAAQPPAGAR